MQTDEPTEQHNGAFGFLFPTRIGRLSYILRSLTLGIILLGVHSCSEQLEDPKTRALVTLTEVALVMIYYFWFVVSPRIRDFGLPILTVVLFFIPLLNGVLALFLLLGPQNSWQVIQSKINRT